MNFLEKSYKIPTDSKYLNKFPQGETNFRVLSSAVVGYEYWRVVGEKVEPVRSKTMWKKMPVDVKPDKDGTKKILHFWSFVVWSYEENNIKIMEIKQKSIMNAIKDLVDNKNWGNPTDFDITITKSGEGFDTKYTVMPNPKTELQKEIKDEYKENPVNLEALFSNGDPFDIEEQPPTQEQIEEDEEILKAVEAL